MSCCKDPIVEIIYVDPRYNDPTDLLFQKPRYETEYAAAIDLRAAIQEPLELGPDECKLLPTGIKLNMPNPYMVGHILPRSGLGHKHGVVLGNLVGEIDSDFQGQVMISAWNRSKNAYTIAVGERIAQMEFVPILRVQLAEVTEFADKSARGEDGFGSSGKR